MLNVETQFRIRVQEEIRLQELKTANIQGQFDDYKKSIKDDNAEKIAREALIVLQQAEIDSSAAKIQLAHLT